VIRYLYKSLGEERGSLSLLYSCERINEQSADTVSEYSQRIHIWSERKQDKPLRAERGLGQAKHRYKDRETWLGMCAKSESRMSDDRFACGNIRARWMGP